MYFSTNPERLLMGIRIWLSIYLHLDTCIPVNRIHVLRCFVSIDLVCEDPPHARTVYNIQRRDSMADIGHHSIFIEYPFCSGLSIELAYFSEKVLSVSAHIAHQ